MYADEDAEAVEDPEADGLHNDLPDAENAGQSVSCLSLFIQYL